MDLAESAALAIGSVVVGAGLSYLVQRVAFGVSTRQAAKTAAAAGIVEDIAALRRAIAVLETDNAILKKDVLPLSLAVQQWAVAKLTHNHTPEMDALLARIGELTDDEMARLDVLLQERVVEFDDPQIDAIERLAASMLLDIMSWVRETAKAEPTPQTMQMVSTPPDDKEAAVPEDEKPKPEKA